MFQLPELLSLHWFNWMMLLVFILGIAIIVLLFLPKAEEKIIRQIQLKDLSELWTRKENSTIHISELSPLWRDEKVIAQQEKQPSFTHQRATAFYTTILQQAWFAKFPTHQMVCEQLLQLLDAEGNIPSVVNVNSDVEGKWDDSTYQVLAQTTLLDHSLNVAEQVAHLLQVENAVHVIPDTMIAALAHDLGKLESMRGYLYSLGEHPLASCRPLSTINEFRELTRKDEILQAIKLHHKRPQGLLGTTLKKADQLARQQELEKNTTETDTQYEIVPPGSKGPAPTTTLIAHTKSQQADSDIYGDETTTEKKQPQQESPNLVDINRWFDAERFLEELKPYINKLFNRRFLAFSMPDGHVYFQTKVIEDVARKLAEKAGCMDIATMAPRDPSMREVLFSVVHHFRLDHDVIARGLIKDTFFGGYFTVQRKIGKTIKGYYTPFHAEVFGPIAEFEKNKPKMLRDIIQVTPHDPYAEEDDQ